MMRCSPMQQRKRPSLCFGSGLLCSPTDAARPAPSRRETRPVKSVTGTSTTQSLWGYRRLILLFVHARHCLSFTLLHVFCLATSQAPSCGAASRLLCVDHCELICGRAMRVPSVRVRAACCVLRTFLVGFFGCFAFACFEA